MNDPTNGYPAVPGAHPPDRVADVMARYQQLMAQFLETERAVMLGYLDATGAQGTVPSRAPLPAPSLQIPAPAAPPAPAQLAPPAAPAPAPAPVPVAPAPAAPVAPAPAAPVTPAPAAPVVQVTVAQAAPAPAPAPPPAPAAAPAPAPSPAPAAAAPAPAAAMSRAEIEAKLLEVVSERTGYPTDMLELDADLEGDLGIDSIKRVEVAGSFTADLGEEARAAIDMEQLTGSRTLREVVEVLERGLQGAATEVAALPFEFRPADTERIGRFVVGLASAPAITATAGLAAAGAVVILDDASGLGPAIAERLEAAVVLAPESAPHDEREAAELVERLSSDHGGIRAVIHLGGESGYGGLEPLFLLVRAAEPHLTAAAAAGGAAVLGVTRGAGTGTAITGFLKTLALEWPAVRVKAVNLEPDARLGAPIAEQLLTELHAADGLVEVLLRGGERVTTTLAASPLATRPETPALGEGSVVLVTGGARGITAEAAVTLAQRYRPRLILVGRTELIEEPAGSAGLAGPADLRRLLIEARRAAGEPLTPALVEAQLRAILRVREVREYIDRMERAGAIVEYLTCDVSDQDAFGALIDDVYARHGRIDGVLHGAGVIEDRLIVDKALDSLRRVVAAKADSARTLAARLRPEGLRFLCLFSSVSGRFGNRGQSDYAAASEALAGLARELDAAWPGRVLAIDWGPWSGVGMASSLEEEFTRRGVALIDVPTGTRMLVEELERGATGETEIVIGAAKGLTVTAPSGNGNGNGTAVHATNGASTNGAAHPEIDPDTLALARGATLARIGDRFVLSRALSVAHDRYLDDHRVDGKPVFPFAAAMELMAEAATLAAGREPVALDDIRLLKGVTVPDGEQPPLRAAVRPLSGALEVVLEGERPHYRSAARFEATAPVPEAPAALPELAPFPLSVAGAYDELLFHGPIFHGIREISGLDARGASALLVASDPAACVAGAGGARWLLDPVLIDSALQVQVIWGRLEWDVFLLPAQLTSYRSFAVPEPGEVVRHELRVRPDSAAPMSHCDHWFFGADGRLLATLTDMVGVGSRALNRLSGAKQ